MKHSGSPSPIEDFVAEEETSRRKHKPRRPRKVRHRKVKMKAAILSLLLTTPVFAEGIPLEVLSHDSTHITFSTRTDATNWYLYASESLIYSDWVEVHHATLPPGSPPKTYVFVEYYSNPLPPYQCRPHRFFHARTDELIPALREAPGFGMPSGE